MTIWMNWQKQPKLKIVRFIKKMLNQKMLLKEESAIVTWYVKAAHNCAAFYI